MANGKPVIETTERRYSFVALELDHERCLGLKNDRLAAVACIIEEAAKFRLWKNQRWDSIDSA